MTISYLNSYDEYYCSHCPSILPSNFFLFIEIGTSPIFFSTVHLSICLCTYDLRCVVFTIVASAVISGVSGSSPPSFSFSFLFSSSSSLFFVLFIPFSEQFVFFSTLLFFAGSLQRFHPSRSLFSTLSYLLI